MAGGGGKGMRRVFEASELEPALDLVRREAESAFGDPALLIEKLVLRPRHLEESLVGSLQRVQVDDEEAPDEMGSLSASAEALRLTAAAPPRNNNAGGDYE